MKKKLLAFFLILGLVLTQAASLSALAEESPSEEPLVTVETETLVEDSSANGGDDISVLSVADGGEVLEEAVQEGPVVTSADSAEPAFLGEPATQSSTDPETSFFGVLITDADGNGNASGSRYEMFYAGMEGESSRTSASNNFVENGDGVFLQAYPADGYKFLGWYQGDPDKADGKLYTGEPLMLDRTYEFTAPIGLERPYVCAVFDVDDSPQADQVQMWVGNIVATPGGASAQGGKVAVKYTPSYDVYPDIKAKDGTNFVYGDVLQFYKGDECTVYQQPDPGYRFVGWYHANVENIGGLFYEGDPISTEDTFTYKPGKTVVPGDTEPLRYVCAVFEKEEAATVTVTFDAQGGTPEPAPQTIESGGKPTKPADPSREGWRFRGWYTDKVYTEDNKFDFDTPVTEDMTLYAGWAKVHMLIPYDITKKDSGGGAISYDGSDPVGMIMVTAFDGETHTLAATPNEGYEFVGLSTSNSEDDVFSTDAEYTYESKDAGDWFALFKEKLPTLTLHWSSIDGVDLMDPIVIENIEKGTQVYEALGTIDLNMMSHPFEKEGYIASDYKVKKPITDYADRDAMENDGVDAFAPIESNMDIYCVMMKAVDTVEVTVDTPVCGTIITAPPTEGYPWSQADPPSVSIPDGAGYKPYIAYDGASPAIWVNSVPDYEPFEGTIIGEEAYSAQIWLDLDFGYIFSNDVGITVNGGSLIEYQRTPGSLAIIASVTAVHDPAEAVEENREEPTCTVAGSYDEVVYCNGCHTELSRETKEIPALGHAWGEWIVDKEATEEEAGHRYHVCSRCDTVEEEEIPMIVAIYGVAEGDGATWYTGSNDSLTFTFKRSVNDEKTFDLFQRIEIDGKEVAPANYEAKAGSVIITLKPEYIKTLAVGKHTLTAFFENGKTADATFTIAEKKADVVPGGDTAKKGTGVKTGDNANTVLYIGLSVAALLIIAAVLILMKRRSRHEQ